MTGIPHRAPIVIVVGRPIPVPHDPNPPHEMVEKHLQKFIEEMQALFERNKAASGCANQRLRVF